MVIAMVLGYDLAKKAASKIEIHKNLHSMTMQSLPSLEASRLKEPQVGPSKATLRSFAPIGSTFKATWQLLPLGVPQEVTLHELFE